MRAILVLFTVVAAARAVSVVDLIEEEWDLFKLQYTKKYDNEIEERFRMKIFMDNKLKIYQHNKLYQQGQVPFKLEMNHFGDLLHREFTRMMNGYKRNESNSTNFKSVTFIPPYNVTVPTFVDWRTAGAVTPVKNQGKCGSCWSFSTTGALEGQHFRKTGQLVSLSEQNLIDCSRRYGNNGCHGGWMSNAFHYIYDNKGIDIEESYPYEARDNICRYNPANSGAKDTGYINLPQRDENQLKIAVATVGPISVAIDASHQSFQFYSSGLYYENKCSETQIDHAVLVVGYGTTARGEDYWLVKNSWGQSWGTSGYITMARNNNNNCGIASYAMYPLV